MRRNGSLAAAEINGRAARRPLLLTSTGRWSHGNWQPEAPRGVGVGVDVRYLHVFGLEIVIVVIKPFFLFFFFTSSHQKWLRFDRRTCLQQQRSRNLSFSFFFFPKSFLICGDAIVKVLKDTSPGEHHVFCTKEKTL